MARSDDDYYEILGVSRYATDDDIKKAFRKLARDTHPDKNPNDPSAKERFQNLQRAYDTLKDQLERSKYDEDNPTHGHGAGTSRHWGASARATRSTTAQRYAGSSVHTPPWATSNGTGFNDGFAQQASRSRAKPDHDPFAEFTSARKTKAGHTYETGGTFRGSGKPASAEYEDVYTAYPPKRESAYARTSTRQYTSTPRHSGAASPRPKSTTGTQGHSGGGSRHTASNEPSNPEFNLGAYIREKRAKELAKEEEDQRIEEAQREEKRRRAEQEKERAEARKRDEEDRRARHRRAAADRIAAAEAEAARRKEAEEVNNSYRRGFGTSNGYATRNKSAYASYSQSEEDDLMKEAEEMAEEKLKESGTHSHHRKNRHTATATGRKKSPVKQPTNFNFNDAEPASPKPPTKSEWFARQNQNPSFTFRGHAPSPEDVHVFDASPTTDSEKSEPERGDYFDASDSKENMSHGYGTYVGRNGPKHTSTFGASKAHARPQSPLGRRGSVPNKSTAPGSPPRGPKRDVPDSTKTEAWQKPAPTNTAEFIFGDGINPFKFQEASSPQQERPNHQPSTTDAPEPGPYMPSNDPNAHVGENDSSGPTRPKSQPTNDGSAFTGSSTSSNSNTTDATKKESLLEALNFNIKWLPSHSDSSSSPRKKQSLPFLKKKKLARGRPASTDGKYRQQPTIDTDSESDNPKAFETKAAPRPAPQPAPQPAEDAEPMDTELDTGIPEPAVEPRQQRPQVNNTHAPRAPHPRPATVQPSSTLGTGLEGMSNLGAVPPLSRSPADVGLGGWDEVKQNLPFPSQAETKGPNKPRNAPSPRRHNQSSHFPNPPFWNLDPPASAPVEPAFEVPQPPKVPKKPIDSSLNSYNRFYELLGPYISEWNNYEATVQKMRGELTSKGMEIPIGQLDVEAIKKYISRVQEKDSVLDEAFRKARKRHIDALESWVEFRNQVVPPKLRGQ